MGWRGNRETVCWTKDDRYWCIQKAIIKGRRNVERLKFFRLSRSLGDGMGEFRLVCFEGLMMSVVDERRGGKP